MTDAVKLPPMPENLFSKFWTLVSAWELSEEGDDAEAAVDKLEIFIKDRMRAYAIQAVMDERALQVSTAREVQPEKGESLGNSIAPAAGNLVIAMEEAIASIEAGMHQGAADTLRAALWTIRAQPEVS